MWWFRIRGRPRVRRSCVWRSCLDGSYVCRTSLLFFFFSSRRRHTRFKCDWSSDVCSSDLSLVPSTQSWKLDHLWVLPQFMDRGIGRALVAHALETAARGGASCVIVDADRKSVV